MINKYDEGYPMCLALVRLSGTWKLTTTAMEMLLVKRRKTLEQQGLAKGFETSQDQIIGEGIYIDP